MNFRTIPRTPALVLILCCFFIVLRAQDSLENTMISMQEIITEIASRSENEVNMDELADALDDLAENPIHINSATDDELNRLFWLSEFQIQNIKKYIILNGFITSVFELVYIDGLTELDAKILSPFLLFDMTKPKSILTTERLLHNSRHRIMWRFQKVLERQKGFKMEGQSTPVFKGDPVSAYFRYSYQLDNKVLAGFTAAKDAGEEFFSGSNKSGFDFYSGYLQLNNLKFIKKLIIGDYRVYFGQGLAVWSGFNFGKSPILMTSMHRTPGISRYQSSDENNFFRGAAVILDFKPIELTFWASRHSLDANITSRDTINNDVMEVSSIQTSGLHTTASEINDEKSIHGNVFGGNVSLIKEKFRAGFSAIYYTYSSPLMADLKPYNYYYFRGKSNYNLSCDFRYRTGNLILFGEEAVSKTGGIAVLNGAEVYVGSRLSFVALSRLYQRNYQAMYANAFGENSRNNNEGGIFLGLECKPFKYITVSGYIDAFRFPWITYSADMPSSGRDFLTQINIDPNSTLQMYLQFRNKTKDYNYSGDNDAKNILMRVDQKRIRYNLSYIASDHITLRSRMELSFLNEISDTQRGFYLGQDIEFSPNKVPLRLYLRYAMFDTDDYDSRVYVYESDLLYAFSIPAFYDQGSRTYIMLKFSPSRRFDFWVKYGITQYSGRSTVGSGFYEIKGNHKSEVKVQVLMKL